MSILSAIRAFFIPAPVHTPTEAERAAQIARNRANGCDAIGNKLTPNWRTGSKDCDLFGVGTGTWKRSADRLARNEAFKTA